MGVQAEAAEVQGASFVRQEQTEYNNPHALHKERCCAPREAVPDPLLPAPPPPPLALDPSPTLLPPLPLLLLALLVYASHGVSVVAPQVLRVPGAQVRAPSVNSAAHAAPQPVAAAYARRASAQSADVSAGSHARKVVTV